MKMEFMNKKSAMDIIGEVTTKYGFVLTEETYGLRIAEDCHWSETWVSFTILDNYDWDLDAQKATITPTFSAAICRMGGSTSPEELLKAADSIKRAAQLVEELNSMDIHYTIKFSKEED